MAFVTIEENGKEISRVDIISDEIKERTSDVLAGRNTREYVHYSSSRERRKKK